MWKMTLMAICFAGSYSHAAPQKLQCTLNSSAPDGSFSYDIEMTFDFTTPIAAEMHSRVSTDDQATWQDACYSNGDLAVHESQQSTALSGNVQCVDGSVMMVEMVLDTTTMKLKTRPDDSALVYDCSWL